MNLLNGNHGRGKVSFSAVRSVPSCSRYVAQMMKGQEKNPKILNKLQFLNFCAMLSESWWEW